MSLSLRRLSGVTAMIAAPVVALALSCGSPIPLPETAEFGKLDQPCFPGDTCDPGLTCLARAIEADGANLGDDGGKCYCLGGECEPKDTGIGSEASEPDADASEQ